MDDFIIFLTFFFQLPDIGAELTGGCYGFAAKYMHWPEELIVGGAKHNKTGHLTRAAALQTVVQLMGERELYDFWAKTYRVHHIDWSQDKASLILETWQRAFSNEIKKQLKGNGSAPYNLYAFSTTTMNDILGKYSEISVIKIAIGCGLMVRLIKMNKIPSYTLIIVSINYLLFFSRSSTQAWHYFAGMIRFVLNQVLALPA